MGVKTPERLHFLPNLLYTLISEFTRLDPVTLANDDPLLRVGHVHAIVLDRRNVGASPAKLFRTFLLSEGKMELCCRNKPRVEVERERRPRRRSGRRRLPNSDVRLFGHHVEVQNDVAVALLIAICTKMK